METAIGVFASRDRAEEAIRELRQCVPDDSIVFLTRSENEATRVGKEFGFIGGVAGGATGLYAGIVASLLVPGLGPVFALGAGAAALLGVAGATSGAAIGRTMVHEADTPEPTADEKSSEDAAFFREVLKEGRSLIVVRTESKEVATAACAVLDILGLGMRNATPLKMQAATRLIDDVAVLEISGRITMGEGNVMLRDTVRGLTDKGYKKIVLTLGEVEYIDSSGIGELVRTHTSVGNQGGKMKLANLSRRVNHLLEITKLDSVFDIEPDEASALRSLKGDIKPQAVA